MTAVLCYRLAFSGQWHEPPKRIWWQEDWRLCAEPIVFGFRVRSGCISHSSGDSVMDMNTLPINVSHPESRVSVIGILTRYGMDVSAFESQQEKWFFFSVARNFQANSGVHPVFCTRSDCVLDRVIAAEALSWQASFFECLLIPTSDIHSGQDGLTFWRRNYFF